MTDVSDVVKDFRIPNPGGAGEHHSDNSEHAGDAGVLQRRGERRATINEVLCGLRRVRIYVL